MFVWGLCAAGAPSGQALSGRRPLGVEDRHPGRLSFLERDVLAGLNGPMIDTELGPKMVPLLGCEAGISRPGKGP